MNAQHSSFDHFLAHVLEDPAARAAFEDSQSRSRLVDVLVRFRQRLGLTQTEVATHMGVKQPTISGFETEGSDPRLSTIQRYARSVDAVVVWEVRPRLEGVLPAPYSRRDAKVELGISHAAASPRARGWIANAQRVDFAYAA